jgi:hypothetical protein
VNLTTDSGNNTGHGGNDPYDHHDHQRSLDDSSCDEVIV